MSVVHCDAGARIISERRQIDRVLKKWGIRIPDVHERGDIGKKLFGVEDKTIGHCDVSGNDLSASAYLLKSGRLVVDSIAAPSRIVGSDMNITVVESNVFDRTDIGCMHANRILGIGNIEQGQRRAAHRHHPFSFNVYPLHSGELVGAGNRENVDRISNVENFDPCGAICNEGKIALNSHILGKIRTGSDKILYGLSRI